MLICVSGLPGHGKTLFTLCEVEKRRRDVIKGTPYGPSNPRPVYYNGIADLKLDWIEVDDPKAWDQLPAGSIFVIDECYRVFEKRPAGSKPPPHVEALARHRHGGIDIYLIAQTPANQIDFFVRGLIGRHHHVRRIFGSQKVRVFNWERLADPGEWHDRKEAVQHWFSYPREAFDWYKSAEVHTVQRQLPWKHMATVGVGLVAIPGLMYLAYRMILPEDSPAAKPAVVQDKGVAPSPIVTRARDPSAQALADARSFLPTIPEIPYTTPAFAAGVRISQAPVVAGCGHLVVGRSSLCKCNDQQGNILDIAHRTCLQILKRGVFNPMGVSRYPSIPAYVPPLPGPVHLAADSAGGSFAAPAASPSAGPQGPPGGT